MAQSRKTGTSINVRFIPRAGKEKHLKKVKVEGGNATINSGVYEIVPQSIFMGKIGPSVIIKEGIPKSISLDGITNELIHPDTLNEMVNNNYVANVFSAIRDRKEQIAMSWITIGAVVLNIFVTWYLTDDIADKVTEILRLLQQPPAPTGV